MKSGNWMAFYVGDYTKNTLTLTTHQHGAYLLLILACWQNHGSVDADDATLASATKMSTEEWLREKPKLAPYFEITPERWTHRRVLDELAARARLRSERSVAGRRGAAKRWGGHAEAKAEALAEGSQSDAPSPSPSPSHTDSLEERASRARLIPEDWQPAAADLAALRQERPDVVGEVYERRLRDFRDWCRAKAVTSHDIASTWRSFMRRTDPPRESPPWRNGKTADSPPTIDANSDDQWRARLRGYKAGGRWNGMFGPRPESGHCYAPPRILEEWREAQPQGKSA